MSSQPAQSCLSFSQLRNESLYKCKSQATALLTAGVSEFPISLCKYQLISNSFSKAPQNPAKAVFCFAKGRSGSPYTGLTRAQSMSSNESSEGACRQNSARRTHPHLHVICICFAQGRTSCAHVLRHHSHLILRLSQSLINIQRRPGCLKLLQLSIFKLGTVVPHGCW